MTNTPKFSFGFAATVDLIISGMYFPLSVDLMMLSCMPGMFNLHNTYTVTQIFLEISPCRLGSSCPAPGSSNIGQICCRNLRENIR